MYGKRKLNRIDHDNPGPVEPFKTTCACGRVRYRLFDGRLTDCPCGAPDTVPDQEQADPVRRWTSEELPRGTLVRFRTSTMGSEHLGVIALTLRDRRGEAVGVVIRNAYGEYRCHGGDVIAKVPIALAAAATGQDHEAIIRYANALLARDQTGEGV